MKALSLSSPDRAASILRYTDRVRPIRKAGDDPAFLVKALGEASGELRATLHAVPRRALLRPAAGIDDGWCLMGIALHLRDVERGTLRQVETILGLPGSPLEPVDLDDIPLLDDCELEDKDSLLEEFHYLRRMTTFTLWDLPPGGWERTGQHPYLGEVALIDIARDLYKHDLEHLWQAQRMLQAMAGLRP
ncbi:MAG: hypothetical protein Kow0010_09270 [Dehalococcoidia bacterium]